MSTQKRKHKLEIQVYEADYEKADAHNGQPEWRLVQASSLDGGRPNIIEVADKAELSEMQKQYAMCEQRMKIIRELDPFPWDGSQADASGISAQHDAQPSIATPTAPTAASATSQLANAQPVSSHSLAQATPMQKPKPKVVTIGDVEIKYDGDKVYQKLWVKLTPAEASNFRIVNDANNKTINMNGKHIEAKRWTLVESSADDGTSVESLIQG